ncbi:lipopolysaccharide biosynthesis protein [Halobacillus sp. KGW1]|uniref:lipopolysaccharide biosynthesis protein n=1 Tax=Halobacillus sp. KGW1 TaxID=1793726 RepID=UPI000784125D|nr:oligosaccharide flippase family protein [Halobacillus sp. KGW1]
MNGTMTLLKGLKSNKFFRNVLIMISGTAAAQIISFILSPIITRLYGPEAYGIMGTFMALIIIITPIASLTFPSAIVLPRDDGEAKGLIRISIYVSLVLASITFFIILIFQNNIVELLKLDSIQAFLYLIPLVIILAGIFQVTEQWLIRKKYFSVSAKSTFWQSIITQGSIVLIGLSYPAAVVLVLAQALKEGLKTTLMMLFMRKSNHIGSLDISRLGNDSLKYLLKKYKDFPIFRAPEVFLNSLSQSLPILMLTIFFGPASAGYYSICKNVLNLPISLIAKSVGDVFYPKVSESFNDDKDITKLIMRATLYLSLVGVIPFGLIIWLGPWLFSIVFGADWSYAGEYARWVALWTFFAFINIPSVKSLPVLSAQSFQLKYTIFMLISRLFMLIIGYYFFSSDIIAISLFSISGALLNVGLIISTIQISKKKYNV